MSLRNWSTEDVPARQRFDYWSDAICRAVLNVGVRGLPRDFRGRISARRTPGIAYVSFESSPHGIVRDRAAAARAGEESYLVSLQLGGRAHIRQGDSEIVLQDGGLTLVEGWRPFSVHLEGEVSRVLALVPRQALRSRVPGLTEGVLRALPASAPFADMLRDYMLRLSDPNSQVSDATAERLGDNLCNLLGVVCAGDAPARPAGPALRREALLAFIERNIADPALSPAAAAAHLGVSVRSVHHLLSTGPQSFGALVLERRLEWSARWLADPQKRDWRVIDIASACGFGDLSHFSRAFKARFGAAPRDLRCAAGSRLPQAAD